MSEHDTGKGSDTGKGKTLTRLSVGLLIGVAILAWALARAHAPGEDDIQAFFDYAMDGRGTLVFDDQGAAVSPAPASAQLDSGTCRSWGGTDADAWACLFRYTGTDGRRYALALTATLRATLFRPDRFDIANVGPYRVDGWAEADQRAMFAAAGETLP